MTFNSCLITFEILSANMNKKKSIFLITSVLLLSYFMILINDASAAAGDITPVRVANHVALGEGSSVNLEHDTESGKYNSMVQVDADTYALAYSGRDNDGFISTFTISADGATITEVETIEHDRYEADYNSLVQVDADTYALAYSGTNGDGFISTFTIDSGGDITPIKVASYVALGEGSSVNLEHDTTLGRYNSLVQVDADTYALAYAGTNEDGFISTFTISADGATITEVNSLEHDTDWSKNNSMVQVDADTYALAYAGVGSDGFISTFTISADGATITEVESLEHDDSDGKYNSLVQVDADTYALAYADVDKDGFISTFTIDSGGDITPIKVANYATLGEGSSVNLEHDTTLGEYNSLVQVDADTYALAYAGVDNDGFISTFTIDGSAVADDDVTSTVEINDSTTNGPTLTNSDSFGVSVANIGDLNGDGVDDIAVGANYDDNAGDARGAIHIMFMNTDGTIDSTVEINDSTTNGPTLTNSDFFGVSVANIGDLNGDGVNDIAVGANLDDNAGDGRGAIHIMFMTGSASASASTSSSDCCDRKPPTLQDARIIISSNDPIVATGNDPIHITANVGDTISVILKVTDNKSLDTSRFAGLYTNFIERPDDMSLFYANHYNNLKQVSTSFYEWNVRSDDVAYNYDDTVSWNQTTPFIVTEDTTVDNFIFKNDDHNAVEFFMIPFTMIVNDSMESTQITITVTDAAGNRLHQTLPVILEILGHAPPDFNSNGKVLGFFNESVLDIMILELNGSEDTAPLSALLGISDELLPAWTLDLATWVAEDKIDSADLIVAVEYLINQ